MTLLSILLPVVGTGAVEAPFINLREPYYYLFVLFDQCCKGADSTYNIRFGRSENITGLYEGIKKGMEMLYGGGSLLLSGSERWKGPGHDADSSKGQTGFSRLSRLRRRKWWDTSITHRTSNVGGRAGHLFSSQTQFSTEF